MAANIELGEALKPLKNLGEEMLSTYKSLVTSGNTDENGKERKAFETAAREFSLRIGTTLAELPVSEGSFAPSKEAVSQVRTIVENAWNKLSEEIGQTRAWYENRLTKHALLRAIGAFERARLSRDLDSVVHDIAYHRENAALGPWRARINTIASTAQIPDHVRTVARALVIPDAGFRDFMENEKGLAEAMRKLQSTEVRMTRQNLLEDLTPPNPDNKQAAIDKYKIEGPEQTKAFEDVFKTFSTLYRTVGKELSDTGKATEKDTKGVLQLLFESKEVTKHTAVSVERSELCGLAPCAPARPGTEKSALIR